MRLQLALIEQIAETGYRATRVGDVLARSGLSRKSFYEHFPNKQECLLATFDLVADESLRRVERAYRAAEGWPGCVEAAISELFSSTLENPGAQRLALIEIASVGPAGIERRERSIVRYERFIRQALETAPGEGTVSPVVLKATIGGLNWILYRRVFAGANRELAGLIPALVSWATAYYPTPEALLTEPRRHAVAPRAFSGGRAPGTLAPHGKLRARRGLARGDQNVSRSFVVHSQRERILDAVANLTATDGYAELKVENIAEQAAVSLNAFYEHFVGKEDALLVAFEVGHAKALAAVEAVYTAEDDWRHGVRAAIAALFEFLASEPAFAHMALVDALTATARTAERSNVAVSAYAPMLVPRPGEGVDTQPAAITVEAVASAIYEMCLDYALKGRIRELPELTVLATYMALAPFVGSEEATSVAMEAVG
jgi:AcrR family transcriptional regulator